MIIKITNSLSYKPIISCKCCLSCPTLSSSGNLTSYLFLLCITVKSTISDFGTGTGGDLEFTTGLVTIVSMTSVFGIGGGSDLTGALTSSCDPVLIT